MNARTGSTAANSPFPARTCARWRRPPRSVPTSCSSTSRTPSRPTTRSGARQHHRGARRPRLVASGRQRAHQRPRHPLVLPRRRRRRRGARRGARHRAGAQGGLAVRRGVRRDPAGPDRATQRLGAGPHRHPHPDRDRRRDGQRRGDQPGRPDRLEAMVFGVADYAARSVRARRTSAAPTPTTPCSPIPAADGRARVHWGDQWHFGISRMVAACRAQGLRPIDGPFGDFNDPDGYRSAARRAAALGLRGQVGDPPVAGRARERGLLPWRGRGRPRAPDHPGDGGRGEGRAREPSRSTDG